MDEDFPAIHSRQNLKTYPRKKPKLSSLPPSHVDDKKEPVKILNPEFKPSPSVIKADPLTTRNAVKFLLEGNLKTKVCRYCLKVAPQLTELDQILQVANNGIFYSVALKDMVASFHPFKIDEDTNFPNKICEKCVDRTISSYLFAQQCDQAERALHNCFEDMYEKLNKLDPLEGPKKRGRQKRNPNYNTLYAENDKVMDYAEPVFHLVRTCEPMAVGTPISEFECLKCCEVLPNMESLLNHAKTHPKSMWFNCRLCGRSFAKLYQLKKHLRLDHTDKPERNTSPKFTCEKCGIGCNDYYKYLQHVEKHKFKNVLEHLVEKKMNRLCSICLNQGSDMATLDQTICLHGGCPELSGDKPLFSILAYTLPEKKNKYQELLLPRQASIIKFINKNCEKKSAQFSFSKPILLTVEDMDLDFTYLFFFSDPLQENKAQVVEVASENMTDKIDDFENHNNIVSDEISSALNTDKDTESGENVTTFNKIQKDIDPEKNDNVFGEILYDIEDNMYKESSIDPETCKGAANNNIVDPEVSNNIVTAEIEPTFNNTNENIIVKDINVNIFEHNDDITPANLIRSDKKTNQECDSLVEIETQFVFSNPIDLTDTEISEEPKTDKKVWIFGRTSINNIVNVSNSDVKNLNNNERESSPKSCKFCWVFSHLDKCDFCKNTNRPEKGNNIAPKAYPSNITNMDQKEDYKVVQVKNKTVWLCNICLTTNRNDVLSCQHCKSNPALNVQNIFNLKNELNEITQKERNTVDEILPSAFNIPPLYKLKNDVSNEMGDFATNSTEAKIAQVEDNSMDTEMIEDKSYEIVNFNPNSFVSEAMDTEDFEPQASIDLSSNNSNVLPYNINPTAIFNEPTNSNNCLLPNQYQFSIGTGEKPKRNRRERRQMTRAFHK